ncbi:MAG: glycosyltransferase family 4 protein [Candidatus ainarchaeum sp.]|nr:glycosyltransferase family 4 protein [Candidatus ainarchaeum sp.]
MKIVHVSHHFAPCTGGIETVVMQLCRQMQPRQECRVACLNKCPKAGQKLPARETINGIEVTRVPFIDFGFYKFAPGIARKLGNADIIHVHGLNFFSDFLAITAFLHRKPMVLSTHGGVFHTGKKSVFKKIYFFCWNRLALRAFKKIVCVSKNDFELFSKIVPMEKLALVENGIEVEKFSKIQKEKKENSFIFVGRISRNKRIDLLIDAFAELKEKEFKLHIVGMDFDNLTNGLKARAEEKGIGKKVFFHGEVPEKELLELMGSSEFFVSASEYEGFGITALEAMAAGCIPILNNIVSFREFIRGENGFIADFGESKVASEKIITAIKMQKKEKNAVIESCIEFAGKFSWEKKALEYKKVYLEVAK